MLPNSDSRYLNRPSADALMLFVLLLARVRIDTLAEWAALPTEMLQSDVARLIGGSVSHLGIQLLANRQTTDPVTLILISLAFVLFLGYLVCDSLRGRLAVASVYRIKMGLLIGIIGVLVFGQSLLYVGLRHISGPTAYAHDGGVIQTEVTVEYFLKGVNPYVADYVDTPMAAWGTDYRTALYHYPYLPWTFVFSAPFRSVSFLALGWFDQRFVYLLLFALMLALACGLASYRSRPFALMVLGLNPILASDVIFGQNDTFVLFWIVLGLWLLRKAEKRTSSVSSSPLLGWLAMASFGLACASKPTAWFMVPLLVVYIMRDKLSPERDQTRAAIAGTRLWKTLKILFYRIWPLGTVFFLVVGPWLIWNPGAMYDDVWRWSAGTADVAYQIRGWGFSNFVLALGLVPDRLAYWPFWIIEVAVCLPLLMFLLWRQIKHNSLNAALYGYVLLLFGFSYVSRFLNENYLGYLLSVFALAVFMDSGETDTPSCKDDWDLCV